MKGYLFGEKKCMHKFCPTCGSSLFVDPHMDDAELMVVNVCALLPPPPPNFVGEESGVATILRAMLTDWLR